ncbi:MAG: hypothetical protein ACE5I3_00310 [Phycisphaerae bacterium]
MRPTPHQRAIILPVVLVLIGLLSLTMAGFIFFVRAEGEGILAYSDGQQARLAAESGLEEVIALLREERDNMAAWFDVPDRFRHALVWAEDYERDSDPVRELGSRKELFERGGVITPAWRCSVVAIRFDGPEDTIRFGLTPESAKLHLNVATEEQLTGLLTPLLLDLQIENPQDLINAILDWRDPDSDTREGGAENDYYNALDPGPPYNAKNGPFDSVEELLLVKGITAAVLYGEDVNCNGILDENEDDGEESFPYYDNADGILDYGIAPFLTVWAREVDVSLDNKQRISLHNDAATVQAQLEAYAVADEEEQEAEALSAESLAFILEIAGNQQVVGQMRSAADLYAGGEAAAIDPDDPNAGQAVPSELAASPVTLEEMPFIMDRFSTLTAEQAQQPIFGLININAAPLRVLLTIPGMTEEAAAAIVGGRQEFDADTLRTTAWPLTTETLDAATFKEIAPYITTKAYQFHVEVVGYADHVKASKRLEWIIEMVGPLAQIKYHRDLTRLGLAWPLDDETVIVTLE